MTIVHLVGRWGLGGLERQLAEVVNRLPADRFRHIIVARNGQATSHPRLGDDVRLIALPYTPRDRGWPWRLARLLRALRADVVHNRELYTLVDTAVACRSARVPAAIFSFHGLAGFPPAPRGAARWIMRWALRRYCTRWAVSEAARAAVAATLRTSPESFGVIRNGVDLEQFHPAKWLDERTFLRHRLGLPEARVVLLAVGNITEVKRHRFLLEAIHHRNVSPASYTLTIVGEDRMGGAVQQFAREKLPDHDIRFVGACEDTRDWYRAADAFVLPSRSEGLSNALLEALACGLPVAACDVPANREVIDDERTGLLSPVEDAGALGGALRRLIEDDGLRRHLGQAGREEAVHRFDIARTVGAYARAYSAAATAGIQDSEFKIRREPAYPDGLARSGRARGQETFPS